jgi:hypothetical protein
MGLGVPPMTVDAFLPGALPVAAGASPRFAGTSVGSSQSPSVADESTGRFP